MMHSTWSSSLAPGAHSERKRWWCLPIAEISCDKPGLLSLRSSNDFFLFSLKITLNLKGGGHAQAPSLNTPLSETWRGDYDDDGIETWCHGQSPALTRLTSPASSCSLINPGDTIARTRNRQQRQRYIAQKHRERWRINSPNLHKPS